MVRLPLLYLSHGSPMIALESSPARDFLAGLGKSLPRPEAILVVSAHWETLGGVAVSLATHPQTIHDFGGFPQALYEMEYPVPGSPSFAFRTASLIEAAGLPVGRSDDRGLDHGAWIPLILMYPEADVPVLQLSLRHDATPAEHYRIGQALRKLPEEGVLVIGSGAATHNLFALGSRNPSQPVPTWVSAFTEWLADRVVGGQIEDLLDYRRRAPFAADNHPSEEHLVPLHVVLGAAGEGAMAERIHQSYSYGVLAMDAYAFRGRA